MARSNHDQDSTPGHDGTDSHTPPVTTYSMSLTGARVMVGEYADGSKELVIATADVGIPKGARWEAEDGDLGDVVRVNDADEIVVEGTVESPRDVTGESEQEERR